MPPLRGHHRLALSVLDGPVCECRRAAPGRADEQGLPVQLGDIELCKYPCAAGLKSPRSHVLQRQMGGESVVLPLQGRAGTPARWQHPALSADDPIVGAAALRAVQLGQAPDWSRSTTLCVIDGLLTVLGGRRPGERVPLSDVRARPHRSVSRPRLAEVLTDLRLLDDDPTGTTTSWIDRITSDLGPGFGQPVRHWLMVLFNGDARARPRAASTIHVYCSSARRLLQHWATRYTHLREVTRSDIGAALEPLRGYQRRNTISALRSLFGFAKKHALIFANPTSGSPPAPATPPCCH